MSIRTIRTPDGTVTGYQALVGAGGRGETAYFPAKGNPPAALKKARRAEAKMKHEEATAQPAPLGQVERGVRRLEPERDDEAVRLAHKMAKAAGPQKASTMARACYMLLCTAAMTHDPDAYFEWLDRMKERAA